ncbi:MAG TPA: carboxypeptidase-like regulatory domain-containing protein [Paludibaculum sp.]|jgi:hypothetical protein
MNWKAVLTTVALMATVWAQDVGEVKVTVVDGGSGQGVAGAKVVLLRLTANYGYSNAKIFGAKPGAGGEDPAAEVLAALTGDEGTVAMRVARGAAVRVFVEREGYVQYGMSFGTTKTAEVGESVRIALQKEGMLAGRVVDADSKKPMAGLRVAPLLWQAMGESRALLTGGETVTTDREGGFSLKGLRPGEYVLEVRPARPEKFLDGGTAEEFRALAVRAYGRTYYPGVERVEEAPPLTLLAGGEMTGLEIRMRPRRVASIRGRLTAVEEITDGRVTLFTIQKQGGTVSYSRWMSGKVEAGASFRLDGVEPGRHWLEGSAKAGDRELGAFAFFDVEDRNVDGLELALSAGTAVELTVRPDESLKSTWSTGQKLRAGLQPIGRLSTEWDKIPGESLDGRFVMQGVQGGTYRARASGYPKGMDVGEVRYNGNTVPGRVFTLEPSAVVQKVELVVHPATASIGVSTKAAKATVVAVRVPWDGDDWQFEAKMVECDAEGRGTISGLLAGTYRVLAFPAGMAWRSVGGVLMLDAAPKVEVGVGASVSLALDMKRE